MAGNAILRHPTLTVLQQIEELKTWHKQQSKLSSDYSSSDQNDHRPSKAELLKGKNITSAQPGVPTQHNFDEIPIKVASSNFSDVIENNIDPTDAQHFEINHKDVKPKRKFLRKGEGIARFRMGPQKIPKYGNKNNRILKLSTEIRRSNDPPNLCDKNLKVESTVLENKNVEKANKTLTLDSRPDLKKLESGNAEESLNIENSKEQFQPNSSIDSSTTSVLEKLLLVGKMYIKEREEQGQLEMMDQQDIDSSFYSRTSDINLSENLRKIPVLSSPLKTNLMNCAPLSNGTHSKLSSPNPSTDKQQEVSVPVIKNKAPEGPIWTCLENVNHSEQGPQDDLTNSLEQSLHVRFAEKIDYKSFNEYFSSINSSNQKETCVSKEFDDSEEWKEDSEDSKCCSQCSSMYNSSNEDFRPISPLTISSLGSQNCNTKTQDNAQNCKNNPINELNELKVNSSCTPFLDCPESAKVEKDSVPPILLEKLKELEEEIKIFRDKNSKIKALHESLEKERKQFEKEKQKFMKEFEEKKQKNIAEVEEVRKKLNKDKLVFEKYSKSFKKNPTKEERKEIQELQEQLSKMKEEMDKKVTRQSSAQATVRNQLKLLEADNKKLKEEIKILQSKYVEFLAQKKKGKPFNNTKYIHAINDHISNITVEEHDNAISAQVGYFNNKPSNKKLVLVDEVDPKTIATVKVIKEKKPSISLANNGKSSNPKPSAYDHLTRLNQMSALEPLVQESDIRNKVDKLQQEKCLQSSNIEKTQDDNQKQFDNTSKEIITEEGNVEIVHPNGEKEIRYKNGNIKKINPFTGTKKIIYFNGDIKEQTSDGTVRYYYSDGGIWQTTLPDGLEIFDLPNQRVEKRHPNGIVEVVYPNGCKMITHPDGSEEIYYTNGNMLKKHADKKTEILFLANGQKEIRTPKCIRREYPDGTVRIVHPDGTIETIYSNGRVRLKDKDGNLVMDSGE